MPTTPLGIVSPDGTNNYDLTVHLAAMGVSIDSAIQKYGNVQKGTATQRASAGATAANGSLWVDTDGTKMLWRRDSSATGNWAPAVGRWQGTTSQRNLITYAPTGFEWYNTSTNELNIRNGTVWEAEVVLSGSVTVPSVVANGAQTLAVTFDRPFKATPLMGAISHQTSTSVSVASYYMGVTVTGVSLNFRNLASAAQSVGTVQWSATGRVAA